MVGWIVICVLLICADQWTKYWAVTNLSGGADRTVIPHLFGFSYAENNGAALGILGGAQWFLIALTVAALTAIVVYVVCNRTRIERLLMSALTLIAAGAGGNLIDRLFNHGIVIDFLRFPFLDFVAKFSCNIADVCVTAGGILLAVYLLFFYQEKKEGEGNAKAEADSERRL